jgi:anti-sigma factor RsiW
MTCEDSRSKLDQFLSGELPGSEMGAVEAHLASCDACTAEAERLRHWKHLAKSAGTRFTASALFRGRVEQYVSSRASPRRFPVWAMILSASTIAALGALLAVGHQTILRRKQIFGEIVDQHSAVLAKESSLDVASSDDQVVESWFEGKIPFKLNIPESNKTPFSLLGARLAFLNQIPGAQLVFGLRNQRVSAFVFLENQPLRRAFFKHDLSEHLEPFNLEICGQKRFRYLIVGEVDQKSINQLADLMEASDER